MDENRTEPNVPEPEYASCEVCCAVILVSCAPHHHQWHQTLTNQPILHED